MDFSDKELLESLYVLNKSAKKSRDTQKKAIQEHRIAVAKRAKARKDFIYKIKHLAMKKLVLEDKLKFIGIHKQDISGGSFYLAYYKSKEGFSYHRPATKAEIKMYKEHVIASMDVVPADIKRKPDIGYEQAVKILLTYIDMSKDDIKKLIEDKFEPEK